MRQILETAIDAHIALFQDLKNSMLDECLGLAAKMREVLLAGNKILVAGNGGSAADAQHFAAELVGRYVRERRSWPAIALTTDTSILTAVGNDYGYDRVFSRQIEGLGQAGDMFLAISTSGNSRNLYLALELARKRGLICAGLLGKSGGAIKELVDPALIVPSQTTARIQEAHEWILHSCCEILDEEE